ncbi:MFS transporter [Falsiroseomonas sp. HW251]|uniref:MFS transporter n=1 Tax=Falsiroseomonas sp. HW251 TaxID=3390998 RepID=UPI003D30FBE9
MAPRDDAPAAIDAAELRRVFFRVFPAVGLAMFGAALDQTIVAAALPAIARGLGAVEHISWVVVAYLVATTVAAPVYGRLGDAFGRRRMLLVGLFVYGLGAALCAVAPSMDVLALARLLQGLGGGGLISLSVALIGEVVPPRERGRFQAWIAAIFASASALGPVAGGVLTEAFGWRAVFLLQPPLAMLTAWLAIRRLGNAAPGDARGFAFDWWGLVLFALFVAPALFALDEARRLTAPALLLALGLAAVAAAAVWLLWRQERRAKDPLLPLEVLGEPSIWRANLCSALMSGAYVGVIAFVPMYFAAVRGLSPSESGFALLPLAVLAAIGAMVAGRLLSRTGRGMIWATIGLVVAAALMAATAFGTGRLGVVAMAALLGLVSIGLGPSFPMVQVTVQVAAGQARLGTATASVQFSRALGSAVGTALVGAVLFGALVAEGGTAAELFVLLVNHGPAGLAHLSEAEAASFRDSMVGAFRAAFLCAAALMLAAAWFSARVPKQRIL